MEACHRHEGSGLHSMACGIIRHYELAQNQGKPHKVKDGLESLVCHAFGEHNVTQTGAEPTELLPIINLRTCQEENHWQIKTFEQQSRVP